MRLLARRRRAKRRLVPEYPSGLPSVEAVLEAILFASAAPIAPAKLAQGLRSFYPREKVVEAVEALERRYAADGHGIAIEQVAGGVRLVTKHELAEPVAAVLGRPRTITLSPAAIETLSLIAYKQPVSKADLESIRGVQCDGVLRSLMELELVRVAGRDESLGRAFLYGTTRKFLEQFGLRGIKDLPRPEA